MRLGMCARSGIVDLSGYRTSFERAAEERLELLSPRRLRRPCARPFRAAPRCAPRFISALTTSVHGLDRRRRAARSSAAAGGAPAPPACLAAPARCARRSSCRCRARAPASHFAARGWPATSRRAARPRKHRDGQLGADAAHRDQFLEQRLFLGAAEAEQRDGVLADVGVDAQPHLGARVRQRGIGGDGNGDVVADAAGFDDGLVGCFSSSIPRRWAIIELHYPTMARRLFLFPKFDVAQPSCAARRRTT